jgi:mycarose O-acyltransferase
MTFKDFSITILIWLLLFCIIIVAQMNHWNFLLDFYQFNPLPRSFEFFLGAIGAQSLKAGFRFKSNCSAFILMTLPILVYCLLVSETDRSPDLMILFFIPGSFLFIISTAGSDIDGVKSFRKNRFLVYLGNASFSLYMIHALLLGIFSIEMRLFFARKFYSSAYLESMFLGVFILSTVCLSTLTHTCFESPIRESLLRKLKRSWLTQNDVSERD